MNRIGEYYKLILKNNETQLPITNQDVIITINNVDYHCYTNKDGVARLQINLYENNYTLSYEYKGNNGYNGIKGTNTIIRDQSILSTNIEILNNEITRFREEIISKLTDENAIPLTNQPMTFSVNGIDYVIYTDENGELKLHIEL
ncbi:MAG: hypothetical protein MJ209_05125 [archaeon]|nr:hypothetical protein [archaeon]